MTRVAESAKRELSAIEARAIRRKDKPMLRLIAAIRKRDEKTKNTLHYIAEPPQAGDDIYVPTRMYIDHGEDDVDGGLAEVTKVVRNQYGICVSVEEHPGSGYNWEYLKGEQEKLKKEFGKRRAKVNPDHG